MVTRRDVLVALMGAAMALTTVTGLEGRRAVLGSAIFDWNSFKAEPNKTGAVRKVVQQPTATLDELEIHITTLNPGEAPHEPHKHPDEELVIIKEGTVEFLVNGQKQTVGPGSIVFQASNQMHAVRNVGTVPAIYHVIKWNSPGMLKQKSGGEQ
jgi:XRE family transcriptional regulator, regulator of sulfur utilization